MSAGWVAGSTRARALLIRRLGTERARVVAASGSLSAAEAHLAGTRFGGVAGAGSLEAAQRRVAERMLTELRLLAGWLPPGAGEILRTLGSWFELVNIEDRMAYLSGGPLVHPFALGSLASAWPRVAVAGSVDEVRSALRNSAWGGLSGDGSPGSIHLGLRIAAARRIAHVVPEARRWAAGAMALVVARERFLEDRPGTDFGSATARELGGGWPQTTGLKGFVASLPPRAAWTLAGVGEPEDLWRAEAEWWRTVSADAEIMARGSRAGRPVVVGVLALLAVDAVRTSAALSAASWSAVPSKEAFDALV